MDKEKIAALIERLNKTEKKDRDAVIAETAKENKLKSADAWKLLKEAGFDPNAEPQADQQNGIENQKNDKDETPDSGAGSAPSPGAGLGAAGGGGDSANTKKQSVVLRHKTEYPRYRRAGLVLTQKAETYEVTAAQLEALKKDPWVVVGNEKKDGA